MTSLTEELFILVRPAQGDAKADLLESVLVALKDKAAAFAKRSEELTAKRKGSLLDFSAEELQAVESELGILKIVQEQAVELIAQVKARLAARREADAAEPLKAGRIDLLAKQAELAARFHKLYAPFVEKFAGMAKEYRELEAQRAALNADIRQHAIKHRRDPDKLAADISQVRETPFYSTYMERVCLPEAGLETRTHRLWTPMVQKGNDWRLVQDDGPSPAALKKIQDDLKEREALDRSGQAKLDEARSRESGYQLRNLGPRTGQQGGLTEADAAEVQLLASNATEGEWLNGDLVNPHGGRVTPAR